MGRQKKKKSANQFVRQSINSLFGKSRKNDLPILCWPPMDAETNLFYFFWHFFFLAHQKSKIGIGKSMCWTAVFFTKVCIQM